MKNTILGLLRKGFYSGKKYNSADFIKKLYILKYIIKDGTPTVRCNSNSFWSREDAQNRLELISDIDKINRFRITDDAYFHIINRFENGDGYGIEKERRATNDGGETAVSYSPANV